MSGATPPGARPVRAADEVDADEVDAAGWVAVRKSVRSRSELRREAVSVRVQVDFDLCESNAICMQVLPAVFEVRDDDSLHVLVDEISPQQQSLAEEAVRRCPRQALELIP